MEKEGMCKGVWMQLNDMEIVQDFYLFDPGGVYGFGDQLV